MSKNVFQAIADPTRREIIGLLSNQSCNLNELVSNFSMTRPAVAKHVRILSDCGLVMVEKRGRERYCHARLGGLGEVALWIHQYRRFWNDNLDRLEDILKENDDLNKKQ
ncbi:MAG: metalloregulator ArsR/SmtB family transcription factor [Cyclobacteriaceae bacterium]